MKNIKTSVKGTILTIVVDLSQVQGLSASGKNTIIATSGGNQSIEGTDGVRLGLNVYKSV